MVTTSDRLLRGFALKIVTRQFKLCVALVHQLLDTTSRMGGALMIISFEVVLILVAYFVSKGVRAEPRAAAMCQVGVGLNLRDWVTVGAVSQGAGPAGHG